MLAAFTAILAALYFSSILGLAAPNNGPSRLNVDRSRSRISQNEFQLDQVVTFQTVTNTETQIGTITESCQVTLTPINQSGVTLVRQDKKCKFTVTPLNGNNFNQNQNPFNTNTLLFGTATTSAFTTSETETSFTQAFTSNRVQVTPTLSPVASTRPPVAATTINNVQATNVFRVPDVSAIGISNVAAQTPINGGLVTLGSLTNGAATSLPSAAAAQESPAAAQVPGRKLEVLPIGLGVFAGISVIALIVVGLVTYERTKYRKAFRQRKLAEAGANMGYGGMAERT